MILLDVWPKGMHQLSPKHLSILKLYQIIIYLPDGGSTFLSDVASDESFLVILPLVVHSLELRLVELIHRPECSAPVEEIELFIIF